MAYSNDKNEHESRDKVLEQRIVYHFKQKDWGATIVSVIQFEDRKPKLKLEYQYVKNDETKVIPFINRIPLKPDVINSITRAMLYFAEKYNIREDEGSLD